MAYVGRKCEYWSEGRKEWFKTSVIDQTEQEGVTFVYVACKKTEPMAPNSERIRGLDPAPARVDAAGSDGGDAGVGERSRGTYCPQMQTFLQEQLAIHGSILGCFQNFSNIYSDGSAREALKSKLIEVFKKTPTPGVCYVSFNNAPPESGTDGYIHPSMMSFEPAAYDLFKPYNSDVARSVAELWVNGFNGTLRASYIGGTIDGSTFAWGPDGSYPDFVEFAAIAFVSLAGALDLVSVPAWLRRDLLGVKAVCEARATKQERSIRSLRKSIREAKTSRFPDPIMLDQIIENVAAQKLGDFVKNTMRPFSTTRVYCWTITPRSDRRKCAMEKPSVRGKRPNFRNDWTSRIPLRRVD